MRRLIAATTRGRREFSFPAGEGVQRPSWDGRLAVDHGNVWVPSGASVWEISTGAPAAGKATENYNKRSAAIAPDQAAKMTFVFVTPLKWTGKQAWADVRRGENVWQDVRVFDGDDLEHWLEAAPAVDIWLARLIGRAPVGVRDLSHHWDNIAALTKPALPSAAFLAGRQQTHEELEKALASEAREIPVAATSDQELVDYMAAAFGSRAEDEAITPRLVLVESLEAWNQIGASTEPLILVPGPGLAVDRLAVAQTVKVGHHVVTRRPYSTKTDAATIRLPRAWRHELNEALVAAGFGEERAGRLARECGGYLAVLQRLAAPNAGTAMPIWALDPGGAALAPFVLFGSWNDEMEADREVVDQLTGIPYDQALARASGWLMKPESPFRRNGTVWHLVSREDTWVHLAPRLNRPALENFARIAVGVLSEDDPQFELEPKQRIFAAAHGKLPRHSRALREGLAETLALLGAELVSPPSLPVGTGPDYARQIVLELFPAGMTTHRWFTLSPILTLLAEAAPEEFLQAVERDVTSDDPAVVGLFSGDDGDIFSSSRHHHLMWALTLLAWHPAYLCRAAVILAQLAALEPGGKTSPLPATSLVDIFRLWFPQTGASPTQRFDVIDHLIELAPAQAWVLLNVLLPKGHDAAGSNYPPRWREWPAVKMPRVSDQEILTQWGWVGERLLKLALPVPARLLGLTGDMDHLQEKEFDALARHLSGLDLQSLPRDERRALWECVHELIRNHEYLYTAGQRMNVVRLQTMKRLEAFLRPVTPAERGRWLFQQQYIYMGSFQETPHEKQEEMALEQRRLLLAEILASGGINAVAEFAAKLSFPGLVGSVLGATGLCPDDRQILPRYLDDSDQNLVIFGRCFAVAIFARRDWVWVDSLPLRLWTPDSAGQLLTVLPFLPRTWDLARSLGPEVEKNYWARAWPMPRGLDSVQASQALEQLLKHDRALDAADYVGMVYFNRLSLPAPLLAETLERCALVLNDAALARRDMAHLVHCVGQVLCFLQDTPGNDSVQVARLEWIYLPLLKNGHASPKFLLRELGTNPELFAQCVELSYRKEGDEAPAEKSEAVIARAMIARSLLESWDTHPALLADGGPDEPSLNAWVQDARRRCEAAGRLKSCDREIGLLLASSPPAPDGSWPCVAVRNVLESLPGEVALKAFHTGIFNGRGISSRAMHEGGRQERELANKYIGFAEACQMRWPRVAAVLRGLARVYESGAQFMDDRADDNV